MKNTTIDTNLLPEIWLTWETTKGTFYLDCATGKKQTEPEPWMAKRPYERIGKIVINSGSKPRFAYAKYHADIERLELAEVTLDTTRKEQVHEWRYAGNKYFLGKDKSVVDENGTVCTTGFYLSQYHVGRNFGCFLGFYYRLMHDGNPVKEFKKFIGSDTYSVGSGRTVNVQWTWHIQEWYKTSQKVRKPGREQKLVDKLVAIPVSDVSGLSEKYPVKETVVRSYYSNYTTYITGIMYFERLDDGWSVLRMFNRHNDGTCLKEVERMYLHDDGANRIATPSDDGWVTPRSTDTRWKSYVFVNREEAIQKCNRIKYILPLFEESDYNNARRCIVTALRFPEVEQLSKMGYTDFAMRIARSDTPRAEMKNTFYYYNDKEVSLLKKVGLNKHQFDKYMETIGRDNSGYRYSRGYGYRAMNAMRTFFEDDVIHLDNATFDKYFNAFMVLCRQSWGDPFKNIERLPNVDKKKFIKNAVRIGEKHSEVYGAINDTINQYCCLELGTQPEVDWYFDSYSDVVRLHDAIGELKRAQDAERRALYDAREAERLKKEEEKRKKLDEERKKYEYEDDNYIIRLPENGNEIVREGNLQRICIGGYVSRHSTGGTNLFFIRKKSDPTMPFYAIEMNNGKDIIQIHGYCNKWLGNDPEVIPTVVRWLRKNKIKCDQKILTCSSTGYCATPNYVAMPVVD